HESDDELRGEQHVGKDTAPENRALFHLPRAPRLTPRPRARRAAPPGGARGAGAAKRMQRAATAGARLPCWACVRPCYLATVRSNWRSMALPRATASSSPCWAVFLPASALSISSAHTSRSCTMLPRRRPREFSVGSLLVSSSSGVSR